MGSKLTIAAMKSNERTLATGNTVVSIARIPEDGALLGAFNPCACGMVTAPEKHSNKKIIFLFKKFIISFVTSKSTWLLVGDVTQHLIFRDVVFEF